MRGERPTRMHSRRVPPRSAHMRTATKIARMRGQFPRGMMGGSQVGSPDVRWSMLILVRMEEPIPRRVRPSHTPTARAMGAATRRDMGRLLSLCKREGWNSNPLGLIFHPRVRRPSGRRSREGMRHRGLAREV